MEPVVSTPPLLRPGRSVGDYLLLGELGRGGFGVVFEAEDRRDRTRVALKTLRADLSSAQGQRALTRFLMEVRAVRQIRHPNVVKYIDAGQLDGEDGSVLAYYAMELLHGETLDQLVRRRGPMSPLEASSVIRQAAVGLYTAHCQGIIHRDIKPGNIILTPGGRSVVTDFGVCKILELQNVTTAGQVVGTARYLSPEQFLGLQVDARSDVFALGALLFYLLTGEHLRVQKDLVILSRLVANGEDVRRVKEAMSIPTPFRKVLQHAVARSPDDRFKDALELAHSLEEACFSQEVVSSAGSSHERPLPPPPPPQGDPDQTEMDDGPDITGTERTVRSDEHAVPVRARGAAMPLDAPVDRPRWAEEDVSGLSQRGVPWQMPVLMTVVALMTVALLAWWWGP